MTLSHYLIIIMHTNILPYIILSCYLVNIVPLFIFNIVRKEDYLENLNTRYVCTICERNRRKQYTRKQYTLNLIAYVSAASIAIFLPVRNYGDEKKNYRQEWPENGCGRNGMEEEKHRARIMTRRAFPRYLHPVGWYIHTYLHIILVCGNFLNNCR